MTADAERWNARYQGGVPPDTITPHPVVVEAATSLPVGASAVDIACGWGDGGLWLAQRGATVSCADVSEVALVEVTQRANASDVEVTTIVHDTTIAGTPIGPWDFLTCVHYLDRVMLGSLWSEMAPGGRVAIAIATQTNLERHERPSSRFLLAPGELADLVLGSVTDAVVVRADESWRNNGVHEAWLIAERHG